FSMWPSPPPLELLSGPRAASPRQVCLARLGARGQLRPPGRRALQAQLDLVEPLGPRVVPAPVEHQAPRAVPAPPDLQAMTPIPPRAPGIPSRRSAAALMYRLGEWLDS